MNEKGYIKANRTLPEERALRWQQYEYYCQLSFGMNTIKEVEWGDGFAPPESFWVAEVDTDAWAEYVKNAGMSAIVFTAKHIDGFCLWQTAQTDYSLKSCPNWRGGKGDLVADLAESCRKYGLGFGISLSPWDKHEPTFGKGKAYDDFFCGLLTELLTGYGELFCIRFECMTGTGVNGVMQNYDMARYVQTVRALQPNCCISGLGPDIRWQGTAKFVPRKEEWSVIPARFYTGEGKKMNFADPDLGSRKTVKHDDSFIWYPLEVSVPLRDHWFFDSGDNYSAKTKDRLWKLYLDSVGANAALMLGICPDKKGKFHETDTAILTSFARDLKLHFSYNLLAEKGAVTASGALGELYSPSNLLNDDPDSFWMPDANDKKPELLIRLQEPDLFDKLVIKEHIRSGQRVEAFEIRVPDKKGKWRTVYKGTTIGYKKICPLDTMKASEVKIIFTEFRDAPQISYLSLN